MRILWSSTKFGGTGFSGEANIKSLNATPWVLGLWARRWVAWWTPIIGCSPAVQTSPEAYVMDLFERYGSGEARVATQYPADGIATWSVSPCLTQTYGWNRVQFVYDMLMICLWYAYDMFMICLWYVYDMFMICLWYVYDMFVICLWYVYGW